MGLIMTLYNAINDAAFERSRKMPTGCRFRPDVEANFEDERPISLWSCGFTIGHERFAARTALYESMVHEVGGSEEVDQPAFSSSGTGDEPGRAAHDHGPPMVDE